MVASSDILMRCLTGLLPRIIRMIDVMVVIVDIMARVLLLL